MKGKRARGIHTKWGEITEFDRDLLRLLSALSEKNRARGGDGWIRPGRLIGRAGWHKSFRLQKLGLIERRGKGSRYCRLTGLGARALAGQMFVRTPYSVWKPIYEEIAA